MKDAETLTEPLLDEEGAADAFVNIPPLNPEDPLSGLTDEQIKQSLATFGKNEVNIDYLYAICCLLLLYFSFAHIMRPYSHLVSMHAHF